MPRIPIFTADEPQPIPRSPDFIYNPSTGFEHVAAGAERLARAASAASTDVAKANFAIQDQQDERLGTIRAAQWRANEQEIRNSIFHPDPTATMPATQDIETVYKNKMIEMTGGLEKDLGRGALFYFRNHTHTAYPGMLANLRDDVREVATMHEQAGLEDMGYVAHDNAVVAPTETEYNEIVGGYNAALSRAEARGIITPQVRVERERAFGERVLEGRANILIRTPEGRQLFDTMDANGEFAKMDPSRLATIRYQATNYEYRDEGRGRANEKKIADAQDFLMVGLGQLVTQGKYQEASRQLDIYEDARLLKSEQIQRMRTEISKPPSGAPSDPKIAGTVGLDSVSSKPRTTEAMIDKLHQDYVEGKPGLNLPDAERYKKQIRETNKMLADKGESIEWKKYQQAEQELRASLGIHPDIVASAMKDDAKGRLYAAMLPELRQRSIPWPGGQEDPFTVVKELGERARKSLGYANEQEADSIRGKLMFPDPASLEANRRNLSPDSFLQQQQYFRRLQELEGGPAPTSTSAPAPAPTLVGGERAYAPQAVPPPSATPTAPTAPTPPTPTGRRKRYGER